jgi:rRNA maturation endonuclease Nob1
MRVYHCQDCQRLVEDGEEEGGCPVCGGENLEAAAENPRERDDDDGLTYSDPRDEREDRLFWD